MQYISLSSYYFLGYTSTQVVFKWNWRLFAKTKIEYSSRKYSISTPWFHGQWYNQYLWKTLNCKFPILENFGSHCSKSSVSFECNPCLRFCSIISNWVQMFTDHEITKMMITIRIWTYWIICGKFILCTNLKIFTIYCQHTKRQKIAVGPHTQTLGQLHQFRRINSMWHKIFIVLFLLPFIDNEVNRLRRRKICLYKCYHVTMFLTYFTLKISVNNKTC